MKYIKLFVRRHNKLVSQLVCLWPPQQQCQLPQVKQYHLAVVSLGVGVWVLEMGSKK